MLLAAIPAGAATAATLAAPTLNTPVNTTAGVKVSWKAVKGAAKYRVFVKNGKSWKALGDTTATAFTHKAAVSGTNYTYTVRCLSADGKSFTSGYNSAGKSATFIAAPQITDLSNQTGGVSIKWRAVKGAAKYRVFMKSGTTWKALGNTSGTFYTHTAAVSGCKYTYTVRCVSADGKSFTSDYNREGKSVSFIAAPKITDLSNLTGGVKITWGAVRGAPQYRVFVWKSGKWNKLGDTSSTSFIHKDVQSGYNYTYTVRCLSADKKSFISGYRTGSITTFVKTPEITSITDEANGARLTWTACPGADYYRIYIKNGSTWTVLSDVMSTSYIHAAVHQTSYTYTIRCMNKNSVEVSGYNAAGWTHRYRIPAVLDSPRITGINNLDGSQEIRWTSVEGAEKYRVLIQENNTWRTLADTAGTYYYNRNVKSGTEYNYTVCCVSANSLYYLSAYDTVGFSHTYVAPPVMLSMVDASNGVLLQWSNSEGACGYRIYLLTGKKWTPLADTTETSYLYTGALNGIPDTYTVCCIDTQGNPDSAYDTEGSAHTYRPDESITVYTASDFARDVYALLGSSVVKPTNPNAPLNRRNASEVLVKALGYKYRSGISVKDSGDANLLTTVYYGYFLPDMYDYIYPDRWITGDERAALLKEVKRCTQLKGKCILAFGDSIMYGSGNNSAGIARLAAEKYGMTYYSYAECGTSLDRVNAVRPHIADQLPLAIQDGVNPDIILLNGGTNDMDLIEFKKTGETFDPSNPGKSSMAEGLQYILKTIHKNWTNVPLLYIRDHNMDYVTDTLERQMGEYNIAYVKSQGDFTLDLYTDTAFNTEDAYICDRYTKYNPSYGKHDGIHPNALGYQTYYMPLINDAIYAIIIPEKE